jgi:hypothetical protein
LFYYETIKRKSNRRLIHECRCDERLKAKVEGSTRLVYTGLCGGLEHLKIETRLIDERFASVMGECVFLTSQVCRRSQRDGSGTGHGRVEQIVVLKLQKNDLFLDELVKTEDTQSHGVVSRTY